MVASATLDLMEKFTALSCDWKAVSCDAQRAAKERSLKWFISRRRRVIANDYEVRGLQVAGATVFEVFGFYMIRWSSLVPLFVSFEGVIRRTADCDRTSKDVD